MREYKTIDIVVNNVGDTLNILDPFCSEKEWQRFFRLILGVAIELNNLAIPIMRKKKMGADSKYNCWCEYGE